jgi:hypothetical protein
LIFHSSVVLDQNDKFLLWKSSFAKILDASHLKTSVSKEILFSGYLQLMADSEKKPVKR